MQHLALLTDLSFKQSTSPRLVRIWDGGYTGLAMNITVVARATDRLFLSKYPVIIGLQLKSHRYT